MCLDYLIWLWRIGTVGNSSLTIKRLFLAKYKDKYNELELEDVTRLDEKEKELKLLADGLIGKIVSVKTPEDKKDNVVPMHSEMNKAANE